MKSQNCLLLLTALLCVLALEAAAPGVERTAKALTAIGTYLAKPKPVLIDKDNNLFGHPIKKNTSKKRLKASQCGSSENPIKIDSDAINPFGYSINFPGTYSLVEDVKFNPAFDDLSAITINSNDVILHLNGHRLTGCGPAVGTVGILVNGVSNVTIDSGSIKHFAQYGIKLTQEAA